MADRADTYGRVLPRQARLSDQVAEVLRDEILRRELQPGDKLPSERTLGAQFGVSRTVVREAVRALIAKGLVEVHAGKGVTIATIDASTVVESLQLYLAAHLPMDYYKLHDVRRVVEVATVERAIDHATSDDIESLTKLCTDMAASLDDLETASQLDLLFHRRLAETTGNEFFVVMHDVLNEVLMEARRTTFAHDPQRMARVVNAHRAIVDAIADRDRDRATALMNQHLDDVRQTWGRLQHDTPAAPRRRASPSKRLQRVPTDDAVPEHVAAATSSPRRKLVR